MKNKLLLSFSVLFLIMASGCKKDSAIEGPELVDIFGEFSVLQPLKGSASTADFSKGDIIYYRTKLSIRTPWTIETREQNRLVV